MVTDTRASTAVATTSGAAYVLLVVCVPSAWLQCRSCLSPNASTGTGTCAVPPSRLKNIPVPPLLVTRCCATREILTARATDRWLEPSSSPTRHSAHPGGSNLKLSVASSNQHQNPQFSIPISKPVPCFVLAGPGGPVVESELVVACLPSLRRMPAAVHLTGPGSCT